MDANFFKRMSKPLKRFTKSVKRMQTFLNLKLDPVSRVTGIPGWYWILGIKCSDTTGVGLQKFFLGSLSEGA